MYNWVVCLANSQKARGTNSKFGKERVNREELSRSVKFMGVVLARQRFEERSQEETSHQERCARRVAWDLGKNTHKLKIADKTTFYSPSQARETKE